MSEFNVKHIESEVRSYSRSYQTEFNNASGDQIKDVDQQTYLDFLAGCGSLNYGHNDPDCCQALIEYIRSSGIAMSLDMQSKSKTAFLESFHKHILVPRNMDYRLQFTGPTGANAVEAAIKLARKVTGRKSIIAFTNGFHGCSQGALSLTANSYHRASSDGLLNHVTRMPYDHYFGEDIDTAIMFEKLLDDLSSGIDMPAALIFETIQGEGGLNCASKQWVREIFKIAKQYNILTIVDDIQAGCGRSGRFFSFEEFDVQPDIVTLAKSLSGFGLPMSLVLIKNEYDIWQPAEHNGTFRGNNHAFVTAKVVLDKFWSDDKFEKALGEKISFLSKRLGEIASKYQLRPKGRGFMQGLEFEDAALTEAVKNKCYQDGLIIETSGPKNQVLKVLAPLTITLEHLEQGLQIIEGALESLT